jgi:hypothetical protein
MPPHLRWLSPTFFRRVWWRVVWTLALRGMRAWSDDGAIHRQA